MRPQSLAIDGFGAFRDRVELDFSGIDFFALVGPTGSGKSTIIDAICFALYGSVPRYNNESLVAPIISTGSSEARVSLTFSAGGSTYTATRVARRTAKGATTKEARLERHQQDGPVVTLAASASEMATAVPDLLGLSFAHFTRCVVLPQGEFAKFLHDKPSDRQEVLVKLLELEVYRKMMQAANTRASKAEADRQVIAAVINELGDLSDETLGVVHAQHERLAKLREWLDEANEAIAEIATRGRAATEQGKTLSEHINVLNVLEMPTGVRELATRLADATVALAKAEAGLVGAEADVEAARVNVATLPTMDALHAIIRDHHDLELVTGELGEISKQVAIAGAAVQAATENVVATENAIDEARAALEPIHELEAAEVAHHSLTDLRTRLEANLAAIETTTALLAEATERRTRCERSVAQLAPIAVAVGPLTQLVATHRELTAKTGDLRIARADAEAAQALATQASIVAQAATEARERAQEAVTLVERANAAAAIAVTLHVGDECPVCHHEITAAAEHATVPELHDAQAELRLAKANEVSTKTKLDAANSAALRVGSSVTSFESRCAELANEVRQLAEMVSVSAASLDATMLSERADVAERELANATAAQQELAQVNAELAETTSEYSRLELQLASLTTEAKAREEQRAGLEAAVERFPDVADLAARMARAKQTQSTLGRLEAALLADRKIESARRNDFAGLSAKAEALSIQRATLDARCADHPSLSEAIAQQEAVQAATLAFGAAQKLARTAKELCSQSRTALQACVNAEQEAKATFEQARDSVASLAPPPTDSTSLAEQWAALIAWSEAKRAELSIKQVEIQALHAELRDAIGVRRKERSDRVTEALGQTVGVDIKDVELDRLMTTSIGATQAEITRIESGRQRTAELRKQESALVGQIEVARKLGQLLSAKQFEQWLVATALKSLTAAASEILERLSGHEFGLETTENNDFLVVDHHNADERRPVRTLSGGETFQASLALALALSQELGGLTAQPGRSLDSIFLDEGFGTLDPETLDMVAGTIESLGQDGRMVGIITHVRELAERVPVRFRVTKGERTSTIELEGA